MSQHDMDIANQLFAAFRADLNLALKALVSLSSGAAAPATTYANQLWYEDDTNTLQLRNESNTAWIPLLLVDQSGLVWGVPPQDFAIGNTKVYVTAAGRVGLGTASPGFDFHAVHSGAAVNSRYENTSDQYMLDLYRSSAGVNGQALGRIRFIGKDGAGNATEFASVIAQSTTVTDGAEVGKLVLGAVGTGARVEATAIFGPQAGIDLTSSAGNLTFGTYTPTLTGVANIDSTTAFACGWKRVGDVVTVEGQITIDASAAATDTEVGISLPIASNFAGAQQCAGVGACIAAGAYGESAAVSGDVSLDRARFLLRPTAATARNYAFHFSYRII